MSFKLKKSNPDPPQKRGEEDDGRRAAALAKAEADEQEAKATEEAFYAVLSEQLRGELP